MDTATARAIKQTLSTILKEPSEGDVVLLAIVKSVDEAEATCVVNPIDESAELFDVRLQSEIGKGVLMIPKVGSTVVVTMINNINGHVTMFSDVEKIVFLDGSYSGLVKVQELTEKLNNLENDINNLKTSFSSWVVVPNDGGAALKAISSTWATQQLVPTQDTEIQNEKIVHGTN